MPKIEEIFARLSLKSYNDTFTLDESKHEINERLYEVLTDDFYLKKLTDTLCKAYPKPLEHWIEYKAMRTSPHPETVNIIAKFHIMDQKVDLVDVKFY